ncbi:MFS transporter [Actinosynnema sp. NPDC020468]|uniref:MFS transporter n=1 Tax=Actinosynnema sp. NPDC020468 TaxID=3154488 RepID=UPI0033D28355
MTTLHVPVTRPAAAAFVLFFALGAATAGIGAALPDLRDRFAEGGDSGGLLVSCYSAGALVAIVVCGLRKRRITARAELAVSIALFAVGSALAGLAPSWPVLVGAVALAGCGYGGAVLHVNTAFARGFGDRAVLMLNLVNATFGAGAVAAPFVLGFFPTGAVFAAIGVLALIGAPAWACAEADDGPTPARLRGPDLRVLTPFLVLALCYAGLETGIGAWMATHLTWIGFDPSAAARWVSLYWLGVTAGRFVVPLFARRPAPIVAWCLLTATVATATATVPDLAPFSYAVAGFALAAVFPTVIAWLSGLVSAARQANGLVLVAELTGGVVHPLVIGLLASQARPAAVPLAITATGLASLLVVGWAHRVARPEEPA